MDYVDIDNTGDIGVVSGLNQFLWTGSNFATFLHATDPSLKVRGNFDIFKIDGFIPAYWDGALFDLDNTQCSIRVADFSNMDIKIQSATQRIFSINTNDDSIQEQGMGSISDTIIRVNPSPEIDPEITTQEFRTLVRSNDIFGGISSSSVNWHITNGINVRESETFAVVTQSEDTTFNVTTDSQRIFGATGILQNENTDTSRLSYSDGVLTYSTHDYVTMILRLDWQLYANSTPEDFRMKFNIIIETEQGAQTIIQRSRKIISEHSMNTSIRLPIQIGTKDKVWVETQIDSGNNTTYELDSSDCTLTLE